ncbi:DUF4270 domain-containing protein [Zobellia galactanivorans]|uniref:DUF4270 domain-containing protein n=1 Tax=Zobellia galactanivorans (strain DSM 12802 / CCUG 47099 / CIP 106680 / NCIMB 13871 / Dsij) TaxID=63186 RepID=UPI001C06DF30|nr:DUF4270 domain-containing protein [Zobellia galactanivorans]MBU3028070.1 DUF4270 family protein [Zobellia galactanivorans]
MIFLNRLKLPALAVIVFVTIFASCEEDLTTIGSGVVGGEPFKNNKASYDVFAYNKKIKAVSANRLAIYQLGVYDDPLYGKTEASVTSQVLLPSANPIFGSYTQEQEEEEDPSSVLQIPENETIDSVYLYIPFLTNPSGDADLDGLIDALDKDPTDPNSDTDGGGLTDNQEKTKGSNPLDPNDDEDDADFVKDQFRKAFDLDSIYVGGKLYDELEDPVPSFNLKVQRSTFFMRDLDPSANFEEAQEYYSSQEFAPTFVDEVIYDSAESEPIVVSSKQIQLKKRDDESTEDVDESTQYSYLSPGIRVALDKDFFQENILDKEGSTELFSQSNFKEFLRGLHFSVSGVESDVMFLFNIRAANITISYSYDSADSEGNVTPQGKQKDVVLGFVRESYNSQGQLTGIDGNAVNTFVNEAYPTEIAESLDTGENASKIYLKGGAGSFAEIKLFDSAGSREVIDEIKSKNWIINEANLVFHVADDNLGEEPSRLYLYNMDTNTGLPLSASDADGQSAEYDGYLVKSNSDGSSTYTINITTYLNSLVSGSAENVSLGLTATANAFITATGNAMLENGGEQQLPVANTLTPLGTVLYGSSVDGADSDKKLELEIFYTETN